MKNLLPPRLWLLCIVAILMLSQWLPGLHWLKSPWTYGGLVLLAAGIFLTVAPAMLFHRIRTNIKTFNDPEQLVQSGLFRVTRNPMYLGFTLSLLGLAISTGAVAALLPVLVFFLSADRWYIPFEEARMEAIFGDAYASYCQGVRRWL